MCDYASIFSMHLTHMKFTPYNIFHLLAPFANEFANLFTVSDIANLYPHKPTTYMDLFKIYFFDLLALTGIISNSIEASKSYNHALGLIGGVLYLIFAFTIPNVFMHDILYSEYFKNHKILTGLIIIYLLELCINIIFCISKSYLYKEDENKDKKEDHKDIHNEKDKDNNNIHNINIANYKIDPELKKD